MPSVLASPSALRADADPGTRPVPSAGPPGPASGPLPEGWRIEPQYAAAYRAWSENPDPRTSGALLRAVDPVLDQGLRIHGGASGGSSLKGHARQLALQAFKTYDPTRARLSTHVVNHLQGLRRVRRRQDSVLKVPERLQLDRGYVMTAAAELEDQLGREPSDSELADRTGLSPRRILRARGYADPVSRGMLEHRQDAGGASGEVAVARPGGRGPSEAWVRAVYDDLGGVDQKILEWTLGLGGRRPLSNQEVAQRLRVTPGAVSQRKRRLQSLLDQEQELSPF